MQRMKHKFKSIILASLCLFTLVWYSNPMTANALPTLTDVEARLAIPIETNEITNWPDGPEVQAQSAILMDAYTGAILYEKNIHEQLYPASTTKILTCLIATEQCELNEIVTFSHDAVFDTPRNSSHIAIDEGEELTVEQCLNAILIASANEVAFGLAEHIVASDWEDFAEIMNERAKELGCVDSNFVNPNGLPDENHYTSAYDLAMIGRAFFANELLCKISSTARLDLPATDKQPDDIVAFSKNMLFPGKAYAYEYLVGSKTGYTDSAQNTLVSCAEKNGMKLIAVVMVEDSPAQFADTVTLFNYGFTNFEKVNISQTETKYNIDNASFFYSNNDIFGNSQPILSLNTEDYIILPKTVAFEDVTSSISYDNTEEGQAAVISYTYQNRFLGSVSVDFANSQSKFTFNEGALQTPTEQADDAEASEPRVIFINVFKVFLWIIGIAGVIILAIIIYEFVTNYHFETTGRKSRRSWLKDRRRKKNRYAQRQAAIRSSRRRKKAKRPNRFRDYDF